MVNHGSALHEQFIPKKSLGIILHDLKKKVLEKNEKKKSLTSTFVCFLEK